MNRRSTMIVSAAGLAAALLAGGCATDNSTASARPSFNYTQLNYGSGQQVAWSNRSQVAPPAAFGMASGDAVAMKVGSYQMANVVKMRKMPEQPLLPTSLPQIETATVPTNND